ncbi:hypothetical protein C8Q80DRAFT_1114973 [Daedaleopsis nitida]|nr:hypothetical protein C8Q80DRAFT_1114973 [Daedaleopsis nitida]
MLPFPASLSSRRPTGSRHYRSTRDILLTRARITNLGFGLLVAFAAFSFVLNLTYYFSKEHAYVHEGPYASPRGIWDTLPRQHALEDVDHLIMVPGHAIWKGTTADARLDESQWVLESYQRGGGRVAAFNRHISTAAELAHGDEHSLLVFSGGQTRQTSTTTEAESYMRLARISALLPPTPSSGTLRATTEDHALDSFQNLLFSLARFHEYTGRWPTRITVVGYEMKRRRFTELHRAALRWPAERFEYVGIDAEGDTEAARQGELQNGYMPYTEDMYGCHSLLLSKRRARNPFIRFHSYYSSAPELGAVFNWCPGRADGGQTAIFPGPLPWDHGSK